VGLGYSPNRRRFVFTTIIIVSSFVPSPFLLFLSRAIA
jgi:hypothetical protein